MRLEEIESLAVWSVITEPGDEFGGLLRQAVGAEPALKLVQANSAASIIGALEDTGALDVASSRFGDISKTSRDALERWSPRLSKGLHHEALRVLRSGRFGLIGPNDANWVKGLDSLGWGAPAALWVAGDTNAMAAIERSVALVGSRTATSYGQAVTQELVSGLAEYGYAVISGGAFGVDALAHQSSLALENPTVAVMAGGLDRLYPAGNLPMLEQIAERWALVSEMPPGSSPTKWRFLQRNRLIAAMSQATVVIEAGWRSGSINTANHAYALNRPVGAVPGQINSPSSAGCHRLIREKLADLVTGIDDVREMLGESDALFQVDTDSLGALEKRTLDALGSGWQAFEQVASKAGLTHSEARLALTSLELDALAASSSRGWRRTGSNL